MTIKTLLTIVIVASLGMIVMGSMLASAMVNMMQ